MKEWLKETSILGFRSPDALVRESVDRHIYRYSNNLVVKLDKPGHRNRFSYSEEALKEIRLNQEARKELGKGLQEQGASSELISETQTVINLGNDGQISYVESQVWHQNALSLGQLGFKVLTLPKETLIKIKRIFQTDIEFLSKRRKFLDLTGSGETMWRFPISTIKYLFPLFSAENIVIDENYVPWIVDVENFEKYEVHMNQGLKPWIRRKVKLIGALISVGIITLLETFVRSGEKTSISPLETKSSGQS